jgi:hypothetical protein
MFRRNRVFYVQDNLSGKQESLHTRNRADAERLLHAKNEAAQGPMLNRDLGRIYLSASDPDSTRRTLSAVMEELRSHGRASTQLRYDRAMRDAAFAGIRDKAIIETNAADLLAAPTVIDTNSGWNLEMATAINDGGQIVGVGSHATAPLRAFLLTPFPFLQIALTSSNSVQLQFTAQANVGYAIEYRDSLVSGAWQPLVVLDPIGLVHLVIFTDPLSPGRSLRLYRVRAS